MVQVRAALCALDLPLGEKGEAGGIGEARAGAGGQGCGGAGRDARKGGAEGAWLRTCAGEEGRRKVKVKLKWGKKSARLVLQVPALSHTTLGA